MVNKPGRARPRKTRRVGWPANQKQQAALERNLILMIGIFPSPRKFQNQRQKLSRHCIFPLSGLLRALAFGARHEVFHLS